jgi:hypothetical protein
MNSKTNDICAFPSVICTESEMRQNEHGHSELRTDNELNTGMTLRDYFAAKALEVHPENAHEIEEIARYCYKIADAMIKERNK